jgi:hypothetical protein
MCRDDPSDHRVICYSATNSSSRTITFRYSTTGRGRAIAAQNFRRVVIYFCSDAHHASNTRVDSSSFDNKESKFSFQ